MSNDQRISRLERSNRLLRWCLCGIVLAAAGFALWRENNTAVAQTPEKEGLATVRTRQLQIVDDDGNIVAQFGSIGRGSAILSIAKGGRSVSLSSSPEGGPSLKLDDGKDILSFRSSTIELLRRSADEAKHRARVIAQNEAGEKAKISQADWRRALAVPEKGIVEITVNEVDGGMLTLRNRLGNDVVSVQSNKANAGSVLVNDLNGTIKGTLP